jgi:hypothetical protein
MVGETNFTLCVIFILRNVSKICFAKGRCSYDTRVIVYVAFCCWFSFLFVFFRYNSLGVGADDL